MTERKEQAEELNSAETSAETEKLAEVERVVKSLGKKLWVATKAERKETLMAMVHTLDGLKCKELYELATELYGLAEEWYKQEAEDTGVTTSEEKTTNHGRERNTPGPSAAVGEGNLVVVPSPRKIAERILTGIINKGTFAQWLFRFSIFAGVVAAGVVVVVGTREKVGSWGVTITGLLILSIVGPVVSLWLRFFEQIGKLGIDTGRPKELQ